MLVEQCSCSYPPEKMLESAVVAQESKLKLRLEYAEPTFAFEVIHELLHCPFHVFLCFVILLLLFITEDHIFGELEDICESQYSLCSTNTVCVQYSRQILLS